MKNERLAALYSIYDHSTGVLQIERDGKVLVRGNLEDSEGRQKIENFFVEVCINTGFFLLIILILVYVEFLFRKSINLLM